MATVIYPAIVERGPRGFGVFFPDLPGCVSAGATVQEAVLNAEDALAGHLLVSAEYDDELPGPSELDAIERDPEIEEAARILVRAEAPGRAKRINVTLPEGLIAAIDKIEDNRSRFLAEAANAELRRRRESVA
jgi:predicted RNase H-like HicB family nuclease